jgi:signal transduction histidine kinase
MTDSDTTAARTRRSLATTLAAALLGLSVTALLVAGSLEMYFGFQAQQNSIAAQQQAVAENAAGEVKAFFRERVIALKAAASVGSLLTARRDEQLVVLDKVLGLEPAFRQVLLYDARQQEIQRVSRLSKRSLGTLAQFTEDDRAEMLSRARGGETYVGPVRIDDITSEPMVVLAVPVEDAFGDIRGTVAAEMNLKFMWDLVGRLRIGRSGRAYVVNECGDLIASVDIGRVLKGENLAHLPEVDEFVRRGQLVRRNTADTVVGIQGDRVVATHVPLGRPDWAVVVELPIAEAYARVFFGAGLSAGVIVLSSILATMIGLFLAKRITRPIVSLTRAVAKVSAGDLDATIAVESGDEVGQLAAGFNQMIVDLKKTTVSRNALAVEVAERRRAEAGLSKARARLQREVDEKNDFLRVVSHDLGAPLRNVMGMVDSIMRRHSEGLPDGVKDRLVRVRRNAEKEMALIGELLELSRIRTRQGSLQEVDVGELVRGAAEGLTADFEAKDIAFSSPEDWPTIRCERSRIARVFQNLIDNAAKYMDPHEGACIEAGWREDDTHYTFYARDNGPGIAPDEQASLFHVFRRGRHAAAKAEGQGVGLAAVKAVAEVYEGEAWVESGLGQGSTFFFSLAKAKVRCSDTAAGPTKPPTA